MEGMQREAEGVGHSDDRHAKPITIIVNGREQEWGEQEISFDQVIVLAFGSGSSNPNTAYTVTYKRGHGSKPEGILVQGESVKVKEGMVFNATATDKS